MGMTIGEKIIARAAKVDQVKAGEIHTIEVDRLMSNDGTTHLTIDMYHNQLKRPKIADKDKLVFIMDHNVPAENPKTAAAHRRCVISQKNIRSNYMKEKVSVIRSW